MREEVMVSAVMTVSLLLQCSAVAVWGVGSSAQECGAPRCAPTTVPWNGSSGLLSPFNPSSRAHSGVSTSCAIATSIDVDRTYRCPAGHSVHSGSRRAESLHNQFEDEVSQRFVRCSCKWPQGLGRRHSCSAGIGQRV